MRGQEGGRGRGGEREGGREREREVFRSLSTAHLCFHCLSRVKECKFVRLV